MYSCLGTDKGAERAPQSTCLAWERELLGLYVSGHPLDNHKDKLGKIGTTVESIKKLKDGSPAIVGGIVEDIRPILTKKGDKMAFVKLTDMTGTIELVLFPEAFFAHKEFFESPDKCIKVQGKISERR